ncbi:hypothetical protein BDF20DRAFT_817173 [Mycotypha africana]|uniref:uncharacterized protein n=1 Tax=Mycotypha africana TaxID=64632 RepID=UPI00230149BE|nr:uncharacterized protein BDF20DRAFT_817173 [Mycotypha africana]KAI8983941.1 hypothetical protein BDF20DRAFT_817173 [Mycotypha africana]
MEQVYARHHPDLPPQLPAAQYFRQHYLFQSSSSNSSTTTSTSSSQIWTDEFFQKQQDHSQIDEEALQRAFEEVQLANEEKRLQDIPQQSSFQPAISITSSQRQNVAARTDTSFSHLLDTKDWSKEFSKYHDLSALEQQQQEAQSTDSLVASRSVSNDQEEDDIEDWLRMYQKSFENKQSLLNEETLKKEQQSWDRLKPGHGYRAIHPEYEQYHYTPNNPYLNHQHTIDQYQHETLADMVLALEAKVQLNPKNAQAWEQLGLKQQENERDAAAITALEKAVALDPHLLNAWMGLAVSYTNEHCRMDAYNCLEQWLFNNTKYTHLLDGQRLGQFDTKDEKKRHEHITELFLKAAHERDKSLLDAEVQVGLGILFNMSEEYTKAIDCFKAALMTRPDDYQLWNKLGATLANSRDMEAAIEMYFNALQINPSFVRARYNLAISCMNLGQYREAAEHLLTTLDLQRAASLSAAEVVRRMSTNGQPQVAPMDIPSSGTSNGIWDSLRLLMFIEDLAAECDKQNLEAFRSDFEF